MPGIRRRYKHLIKSKFVVLSIIIYNPECFLIIKIIIISYSDEQVFIIIFSLFSIGFLCNKLRKIKICIYVHYASNVVTSLGYIELYKHKQRSVLMNNNDRLESICSQIHVKHPNRIRLSPYTTTQS